MNKNDLKYAAYRLLNAFGFKGIHTCLQPSIGEIAFVIKDIGIPSVKINYEKDVLEFWECSFEQMYKTEILEPFLVMPLEFEGLPKDKSRRAKLINERLHFNKSFHVSQEVGLTSKSVDIPDEKNKYVLWVSHLFFKSPGDGYKPTFIFETQFKGTFTDIESKILINSISDIHGFFDQAITTRKVVGVSNDLSNLN